MVRCGSGICVHPTPLPSPLTTDRFYWVVNIGALSPLITVNVEAHHSFWLAYLVPLM